MWFLWSGDNCDGTDLCTAIKTLEMKLEAQLKNLYSLIENISLPEPAPEPPTEPPATEPPTEPPTPPPGNLEQ